MERIETSLPGVLELRPRIFRDQRGFFLETYHLAHFSDLGIKDRFVQDNHSCSVRGTLRGLHYQLRHPQAKLCRVIEGEVLDVTVDIRMGSPHFGNDPDPDINISWGITNPIVSGKDAKNPRFMQTSRDLLPHYAQK